MAKAEAQVLAKLDRPPAAHNFARCNFPRRDRTAQALVNLAVGFPQISYQWAHLTIQRSIADGLAEVDARKLLSKICPESQYDENASLLEAFLEYNRERQYQGIQVFEEWSGTFIAGPDVSVPVRPTAILRENGLLKPIFLIGWAHNGLTYYQCRLLTAILEDAIFSLTDFRNSPGEILFFPKDKLGIRRVDRWTRSSFAPLTHAELVDQVERFVGAREDAREMIPARLQEIAKRKMERATQPGETSSLNEITR